MHNHDEDKEKIYRYWRSLHYAPSVSKAARALGMSYYYLHCRLLEMAKDGRVTHEFDGRPAFMVVRDE